ncbi:unnamed protein product [Protopolystoma xenopodis]|uniref:Uncharacterized protein n=1 Tax=Protopolystoma xenopodis TaxID=117903 RepID=A0A3S4ZNL1_9PLAT|nr:unnamed protein product [Protopolystoma xenopodis]
MSRHSSDCSDSAGHLMYPMGRTHRGFLIAQQRNSQSTGLDLPAQVSRPDVVGSSRAGVQLSSMNKHHPYNLGMGLTSSSIIDSPAGGFQGLPHPISPPETPTSMQSFSSIGSSFTTPATTSTITATSSTTSYSGTATATSSASDNGTVSHSSTTETPSMTIPMPRNSGISATRPITPALTPTPSSPSSCATTPAALISERMLGPGSELLHNSCLTQSSSSTAIGNQKQYRNKSLRLDSSPDIPPGVSAYLEAAVLACIERHMFATQSDLIFPETKRNKQFKPAPINSDSDDVTWTDMVSLLY